MFVIKKLDSQRMYCFVVVALNTDSIKQIAINKPSWFIFVSATFAIMCLIYDHFEAANVKIMQNVFKRSSRNQCL